MYADTVLLNGRVYSRGRVAEGGLAIEEGKIIRVSKETNLPSASEKIDCRGCIIIPGLIDAHVHLRGQMQSYKEDFSSGTAAAVAGGITSVLDMPNNEPVTMSSASLRSRIAAAEHLIVANVGLYSAFPKLHEEISRVIIEGAIAFKLFLNTQIGGVNIDDKRMLSHAFEKVSEIGVPVAVHAEDKEAVEDSYGFEKKRGNRDVEAYLRVHKPEVEVRAVRRIIEIAATTNARVHFCHMSSGEAVALIHRARMRGLRLSCEVTPHHLFLTSKDLKQQGGVALTNPPLRRKLVGEKLWRMIQSAKIDTVASDHAPHLAEEKNVDSVWNAKPGIPGLETLLPLLLTRVNDGKLTISRLVRLTAERPAEIFGLYREGFLKEGYNANITVVDMHKKGVIDPNRFYSKAKHSPFGGWKVQGMPVKTLVNGHLTMSDGEVVAQPGVGRILRCRVPAGV